MVQGEERGQWYKWWSRLMQGCRQLVCIWFVRLHLMYPYIAVPYCRASPLTPVHHPDLRTQYTPFHHLSDFNGQLSRGLAIYIVHIG